MGALQSLSFRNIRGNYFMGLDEAEQASWVSGWANTFDSDTPYEIYKWLNQAPPPEKWTGERTRQQLKDFSLTVKSDLYTNTLEFDVDDLRKDKTGQPMERIRELGGQMATLPQRLITELLEGNGNAYDGVAFFGTHTIGSGVCDTDIALEASDPENPTAAEMVTAILKMIVSLQQYKSDRGDPMNANARAFRLMLAPKYYAAAVAAMGNEFVGAAVSNTLKAANELTITRDVNGRLAQTNDADGRRMYMTVATRTLPIIWQEELALPDTFTSDVDAHTKFWRRKVAFGGARSGTAALGRFERCIRGTWE